MTPDKLEQRARECVDEIFLKHYSGQEAKSFRHAFRRDSLPIILTALREAVDAETADLVKHLEWAIDEVQMIKAPILGGSVRCRFCGSLMDRQTGDVAHEHNCPYPAAIAAIRTSEARELEALAEIDELKAQLTAAASRHEAELVKVKQDFAERVVEWVLGLSWVPLDIRQKIRDHIRQLASQREEGR